MKFKKLKSLLAVTMSIALMTGCTGKKEEAEVTTEEIVTEITEPVEITFWHAMNGELEKAIQNLTDSFMKENPNIKVTLQNQSSYQDLQQKIAATVASPKDLPTMTQAYIDWMYNPINDGLVTDLSGYIKHPELEFDDYEDILESFRESSTIDGKIYGIPFNKSTEVLWYNKTLFDELKIEVPKTYEEVKEVSQKIYKEKGIPGAGYDILSTYYTTFVKNEGATFDPKFDPTSEPSQNASNYYKDGINEGYFRIAGTDKFLSGPFANQTLAMYAGSNAGESFVKQGVGDKFEIGVAPYPSDYSLQQGTDLFVFNSASAEQKTAAYQFLKFLTTTENQIEWAKVSGYIPVRKSAISSADYKNSGSLAAPILEESISKFYTNPLVAGADAAYREAGVVMETILADKDSDVKKVLEDFKTTLMSIWE